MIFYLANTSRHDQGFNFRLPENARAMQQPIRIGQQVMLGHRNLGKPDVDYLVEQVSTYGGVRVGDYEKTTGQVVTFIYDVDKEIPRKEIERVMRHNSGQLTLAGKKMREEAAVATSQVIENMTPGEVNEVELTIQEETAPAPGEKQIAEGIIVRDEARRSRNTQQQGKGRRK